MLNSINWSMWNKETCKFRTLTFQDKYFSRQSLDYLIENTENIFFYSDKVIVKVNIPKPKDQIFFQLLQLLELEGLT